MLIDLQNLPDRHQLRADVCIVGAGAAGVTLARSLVAQGRSVCLLEAGGADFEQRTQALCEGGNIGMNYYSLIDSRLRFFGGTTTIWGGRSAPLDDIDFDRRDWVPHSGWPIAASELRPYYESANTVLRLGPFVYGDELWGRIDMARPPFDPARIATRFWRFDERPDPFTLANCADLRDHARVTIVLHANAVRVQAAANAGAIEHIAIAALNGRRGQVHADTFVLACGGLENPRLLLAARDVEPHGIGNAHDQVGRYFMEHPHARAGRAETPQAFALWAALRKRFFRDDVPIAPLLLPSVALQQERGILNSAMTFKLQTDPESGVPVDTRMYLHLKHKLAPNRFGRGLWHGYRRFRDWAYEHVLPTSERWRARLGITGLSIIVRAEQAPNPASRVVLAGETDALGVPKLNLDWQLTELDKRTVVVLAETMDAEFRRLGIGKVQRNRWLDGDSIEWPFDPTVSNHPIGGYHHMGTTRMSADPRQGVVDADCRVHGYRNLYIAGSSVFPTAGWANPTLTLLALTFRLAEHLRRHA